MDFQKAGVSKHMFPECHPVIVILMTDRLDDILFQWLWTCEGTEMKEGSKQSGRLALFSHSIYSASFVTPIALVLDNGNH